MELSGRMKMNLMELLCNYKVKKGIISDRVIQESKGIIEE
jgi:hypothetical protein